jgi:hypothetical protein
MLKDERQNLDVPNRSKIDNKIDYGYDYGYDYDDDDDMLCLFVYVFCVFNL